MADYKGKDVGASDLLGSLPESEIPTDGEARIVTESMTAMTPEDWENLAFMEEEVTILVPEPYDEQAPRLIPLTVNEKTQHVLTGKPQKIKRKYVEVLAQAREIQYKQVVKKGPDGEPINKMIPRPVLVWNFTVISDPNPKGAAWLQAILSRPA